MAINLNAEKFVRQAKKDGFQLRKGFSSRCLVTRLARMHNIEPWQTTELVEATGRSADALDALELGFEGWDEKMVGHFALRSGRDTTKQYHRLKNHRYYKVGQRIAELAAK